MKSIIKLILITIFISLSEFSYSQNKQSKDSLVGAENMTKHSVSYGIIWRLNKTGLTGYDDWTFRDPNVANIGVAFRFKNDHLIFETDIIILETGVRFKESNRSRGSLGYDRQVNTNLMLPFLVGYRLGSSREISPFLKAGIFMSRLLKANYKVPGFLSPTVINNINEFERWDIGISFATGIDVDPGSLELRANWGLRNINKNPDDIWEYVDTTSPIHSVVYQVVIVLTLGHR